MNFLKIGDGKNTPREQQIEYLTHLGDKWAQGRIFGCMAPPGIGKSFIARTIQRTVPNTAIITLNNALVDQYTGSYPELNALKGRDYYETEEELVRARLRAETEDTVFNPLSFYYYYLRRPELAKPTTIVIDEAHQLAKMLLLTVGQSFDCIRYQIPADLTDVGFYEWVKALCTRLRPLYQNKGPSTGRKEQLCRVYETFNIIEEYLSRNLQYVRIHYEMKAPFGSKKETLHLTIQPLRMPSDLMGTIFGPESRVILLSGTLTKLHLTRLYPNEADSIDLVQFPPVAAGAQCPVYHLPVQGDGRWDPGAIADAIRDTYCKDRVNTLVHLSYSFCATLAPLLRDLSPIVVTSKDDKAAKLEEFKQKGGLLLGCGMAEGVDLPGDLCRAIIIPRLLYPNRGDQAVMKELKLPDGETFYGLETFLTTIQQLGRGVRGKDDYCTAYILDPTWPRLVKQYKQWVPKEFIGTLKF